MCWKQSSRKDSWCLIWSVFIFLFSAFVFVFAFVSVDEVGVGANCWEWTEGRHCLTWPSCLRRPWTWASKHQETFFENHQRESPNFEKKETFNISHHQRDNILKPRRENQYHGFNQGLRKLSIGCIWTLDLISSIEQCLDCQDHKVRLLSMVMPSLKTIVSRQFMKCLSAFLRNFFVNLFLIMFEKKRDCFEKLS